MRLSPDDTGQACAGRGDALRLVAPFLWSTLLVLALQVPDRAPGGLWFYLAIGLAVLTLLVFFALRHTRIPAYASGLALLAGGLILFLGTPAVLHRRFFLIDWIPLHGWFDGGYGWWLALVPAAAMFLLWCPRRWPALLWVLLLVLQALCVVAARRATGGEPFYNDDHPSFMFRLWIFREAYPQLASYLPFWNGGVEDMSGTNSGANGLGLLLWPWLEAFAVHEVYLWGLMAIFVVAMPWCMAAACRLAGGNQTAAALGGLLGLGVSMNYFLWLLNYGTMGAALVSFMAVPVAACAFRVMWLRRNPWWVGALLVAAAALCVQWAPGVLMLAAYGVGALLSLWGRWSWRRIGYMIACGAAVAALVLPVYLHIVTNELSVMSFVVRKDAPAAGTPELDGVALLTKGLVYIRNSWLEVNPVMVFLGFGGLLVMPYRSLRRWYLPAILIFAFLCAWGPTLKPNLQLERMSIPMAFACLVPAAFAVERLLRLPGARALLVKSAVVVLVILGGYNITHFWGNFRLTPYYTMSQEAKDMVEWFRQHTTDQGRILFAGRNVHRYGRGHIAYLPVLAGREMMGCDYFHFPMSMVEYEYPPSRFNESPEGTFAFMETYNVSHVVTYHGYWKQFFDRHPDRAELAWTGGDAADSIRIYRLRRDASPFLAGSGTVAAQVNRLVVDLEGGAEEVVIKYNYATRMRAQEPVELFPYDAGRGITLTGIRPRGERTVTIVYE